MVQYAPYEKYDDTYPPIPPGYVGPNPYFFMFAGAIINNLPFILIVGGVSLIWACSISRWFK